MFSSILKKLQDVVQGNTVLFFGDSITNGTGASATDKRWIDLLSIAKGWTRINKGVGGEHMIKALPYTLTSMQDRLSEIPTKTSELRYLFFAYGVNDVGLNLPNYTVELFTSQYIDVINNAKSKGWTKQNIIVVNLTYVNSPSCWAAYNVYGVTTLADTARYNAFRSAIASLSEIAIIKDPYPSMLNGGGNSLLADNLHPNDAGYQNIDNYMELNIL